MKMQLTVLTAAFALVSCTAFGKDPNLVFHCTFDDEQSILSPAAGSAGRINGATFVEGKFGKALYVPAHAAVAEFPFPKGLPMLESEFMHQRMSRTFFAGIGSPVILVLANPPSGNGNSAVAIDEFKIYRPDQK